MLTCKLHAFKNGHMLIKEFKCYFSVDSTSTKLIWKT